MGKKLALILLSVFLMTAVGVTFYVVQQQTELRKKAAPATTMTISPSDVTKAVGDEFALDFVIDTGPNAIQQLQIEISYDTTKLEALSLTNSASFPNILSKGEFKDGKATIALATVSVPQPFTGVGTAATIRFKALAPTDSPINIRYTPQTFVGALAEGQGNSLIGTTGATVTITGAGAQVTPTLVPTISGTPSVTPTLAAVSGTPTKTPTPTLASTGTITPTPTLAASTTTTPTPTPGPLSLVVSSPQNGGTISQTTPTFSGTAKPGTSVTLALYPTGGTNAITTNASGNWTFTPQTALGLGVYTLSITASDPITGQSQNSNISFTIGTQTATGAPTPTPTTGGAAIASATTPTPSAAVVPVTGNADMTIMLTVSGIILLLGGIVLPFIL